MIFEKQIVDAYRSMAFTRCDDRGLAYYFSKDDFEGLEARPYSFKSSLGHELRGFFYSYENPLDKRIVIFEHGFGGGHLSYMKEIEMLCRVGFLVLAYDHTGCMQSGGENTRGMAQSLVDLNDCINALKADEKYASYDISVVGHSWGGFSTLNILALHPEISHIVAISGFVSVELLVNSYFGGILRPYRRAIMRLEADTNPDFIDYNAVKTLSETSAKVLLIYSKNDKLCKKSPHYDTLRRALSDKENVKLLLLDNKGHNPNYTESAVRLLGKYSKEMKRRMKKGLLQTEEGRKAFVASFDFDKMTEQDDAVWQEIYLSLHS